MQKVYKIFIKSL